MYKNKNLRWYVSIIILTYHLTVCFCIVIQIQNVIFLYWMVFQAYYNISLCVGQRKQNY